MVYIIYSDKNCFGPRVSVTDVYQTGVCLDLNLRSNRDIYHMKVIDTTDETGKDGSRAAVSCAQGYQ